MAEKVKENKTIFIVLRRVNLISKIFLVSPYTLTSDNKLVVNRKLSWFQFVLSMVTVVIEVSIQLHYSNLAFQGNPYILLASLRAATSVIFSFLTSVEMKMKHQKIKLIFEEIGDMSETVQLSEKHRKVYAKTVTRFAAFFITLVAFGIINIAQRDDIELPIRFVFAFHITRLIALPVVMELQFISLLALIEQYIEWVKDSLRSRLIHSRKPNRTSNDLFIVTKATGEITQKWTAKKVLEIRCCYGRVNDLKVFINEAFAFRLWLITIYTFVELVFYIFLCVMVLQFWNNYGSGFYSPRLIWQSIWTFFVACLFMQIVNLCEAVSDKGRKIGVLVHQLYSIATSENIREELSAFSMELLHRNPSITAYKFFNIDYPLVSSVLASSLTYIIILLQFKFPDYDDGLQPIQDLLSRS